jgi:hypothetical protein
MKKFNKSSFSGNSYFITLLILISIPEIIEHKLFKLFWILLIIIKIVYINKYSYYIIKENYFITKPSTLDIDILKIKSIHKRKFFFFNKYYFDFKMSQFRWVSIYPLQSDIDAIINDIIEVNPNIIIKEYKAYNENF